MDSDFLKKEKEFLNNIVYKLYKNKKPEKIIFRAFILFKDVFILLCGGTGNGSGRAGFRN